MLLQETCILAYIFLLDCIYMHALSFFSYKLCVCVCVLYIWSPFHIAFMQGFDALSACLDVRGIRESQLHTMLQKIEVSFKEIVKKNMPHDNVGRESEHGVKKETIEMTPHLDFSIGDDSPSSTICLADSDMPETSTTFVIELGRNEIEKNGVLKRYQDLEKWIWKECFSSSMICAIKNGKKRCKKLLNDCDYCHSVYSSEDRHCPSCHRTYATSVSGLNFSEHFAQCKRKLKLDEHCTLHGSSSFPLRIRMLKLLLALVEVTVNSFFFYSFILFE